MSTSLWRVIVGSHAFGTNRGPERDPSTGAIVREGSDFDEFACYAIDSFDLLSGAVAVGGCHVSEGKTADGVKVDLQNHELSRWTNGAIEENLNYMIGLFSPLPIEDPYGFLAELRELVSQNPTTAIAASTLGMARSNLKKHDRHLSSGDDARGIKNLRTSICAIWFARRFIEGVRGCDLFHHMTDVRDIPVAELRDYLKRDVELLEETAERSGLPSHCLNREAFYSLQLHIRLRMLSRNLRAKDPHGTLPAGD